MSSQSSSPPLLVSSTFQSLSTILDNDPVTSPDSDGITSIPVPVPDTGIQTSASQAHTAHRTSTRTLASSTATSRSTSASQSFTVTPLVPPPLSTLTVSNTLSWSLTSTFLPTPTTTPQTVYPVHVSQISHRHISVSIAILLAVGSAFVLLSLVLIIRACSRPRHRVHPTPSLPILEDGVDDNDLFGIEGSPIFGGKERLSRPGSNGLLTWTQYPQPGFVVNRPAQTAGDDCKDTFTSEERAMDDLESLPQLDSVQRNAYSFTGHGNGPAITPANSFQRVQDAIISVTSRLSAVSMSHRPNSPANDTNVGVAIGEIPEKHTTREDHRRNGIETRTEDGTDGDNASNHSQGLAYDGAHVSSPSQTYVKTQTPAAPPAATGGGRTRIKSTYYSPGVYRRMSGVPPPLSLASTFTKTNLASTNSFPFQHTLRKSDSRRERDIQALAEFQFQPAPSPQPTLYPDDSLSITDDNTRNSDDHIYEKPAPKFTAGDFEQDGIPHSYTDANVALGNLMLSGFAPTSKSLASLAGRDGLSQPMIPRNSSKSFRTDDKPPRVPSPPPLPSLTQMAFAHTNPEAYADYRSPTYSVYRGLCDDDRKSLY